MDQHLIAIAFYYRSSFRSDPTTHTYVFWIKSFYFLLGQQISLQIFERMRSLDRMSEIKISSNAGIIRACFILSATAIQTTRPSHGPTERSMVKHCISAILPTIWAVIWPYFTGLIGNSLRNVPKDSYF